VTAPEFPQKQVTTGICPPLGKGTNLTVRRLLRRTLGFDVHRVRPPGLLRITKSTLLFEMDQEFRAVVAEAVARSQSGPWGEGEGPTRETQRLYNLAQLVPFTAAAADGAVVECGCFRGLSAYVLCRYLRAEDSSFKGSGMHLFDSFEGISAPTANDGVGDPRIPIGKTKRAKGMFKASIDEVRAVLEDFPDITFHPGWIPDTFTAADAPAGPFRLVHLDLDVHDPTRASLDYFVPRLAPGGAVLCDDFGSLRWPGARKAVEEYCAETGARLLRMSSGQALVLSPLGWGGAG
jgi:O-methyltransferase